MNDKIQVLGPVEHPDWRISRTLAEAVSAGQTTVVLKTRGCSTYDRST